MPTIMPTDRNLREAIAWIEERRGEGGNMCTLITETRPRYNPSAEIGRASCRERV